MDNKNLKVISYPELKPQLEELITNHESFRIINVGWDMPSAIYTLETEMTKQNLKSRVYLAGRGWASGGSLAVGAVFCNPVLFVGGLISSITNIAHSAGTCFPDYEICKHPIDRMLDVTYCGKKAPNSCSKPKDSPEEEAK